MIRKRYTDNKRLITDADELRLTSTSQVLLYREDKWHDEIAVDLEEEVEKFEELKSLIVFVAKNLCKMDGIAQKYSALRGDSKFADGYEVAYIRFNLPDAVSLRYYGTNENTEFDVVFQLVDDDLMLKSFGMVRNIGPDWDKE